jgi:hypothetical protein
LESVLHKLSFGIKISRLPVHPKPYGKKTDFIELKCKIFVPLLEMIEYILKFYGIKCSNKWIGFLTTGLALSSFSTTVFVLKIVKNSDNYKIEVLFKLFLFLSIASNLFNYLMIKYKSTEIFELNHKLKKFQNKSRISQLNIHIFSIFSVLFSAVLAFITTKVYFCLSGVDQHFEDITQKMESLPIPSFLKMFILNFYGLLWYISTQLLYIEFKINVMNEKSETDSDVLKLTQKFVLKFVTFKSDIKSTVDFLKYEISIEIFSTIIFIICFHILFFNPKCYHFGIFYIVLIVGYYFWTMSCSFRIRIIENDLSFILNEWLHLNPEDSIRIEMDYIEKTVKKINENEFNEGTYEV